MLDRVSLSEQVTEQSFPLHSANSTWQTGYMKHINIGTRGIPSRLVLTANCYCYRPDDSDIGGNRFKFIVDVLLVPRSFKMKTCSDLYYSSSPYHEEPAEWRIEKRRLPGSIILLRRFAVHGQYVACKAEQWNIPQDIRNDRSDYRLVVTCPYLDSRSPLSLLLQLEMEF
jgi:hypothetical protein